MDNLASKQGNLHEMTTINQGRVKNKKGDKQNHYEMRRYIRNPKSNRKEEED